MLYTEKLNFLKQELRWGEAGGVAKEAEHQGRLVAQGTWGCSVVQWSALLQWGQPLASTAENQLCFLKRESEIEVPFSKVTAALCGSLEKFVMGSGAFPWGLNVLVELLLTFFAEEFESKDFTPHQVQDGRLAVGG